MHTPTPTRHTHAAPPKPCNMVGNSDAGCWSADFKKRRPWLIRTGPLCSQGPLREEPQTRETVSREGLNWGPERESKEMLKEDSPQGPLEGPALPTLVQREPCQFLTSRRRENTSVLPLMAGTLWSLVTGAPGPPSTLHLLRGPHLWPWHCIHV